VLNRRNEKLLEADNKSGQRQVDKPAARILAFCGKKVKS
jgi:hypothetical protein